MKTIVRKLVTPATVSVGIVALIAVWVGAEVYWTANAPRYRSIFDPIRINIQIAEDDVVFGLPAGSTVISTLITEVTVSYDTPFGLRYDTHTTNSFDPTSSYLYFPGVLEGWQANSLYEYGVWIMLTCRVELPGGEVIERQAMHWVDDIPCTDIDIFVQFGRGDWKTLSNFIYSKWVYLHYAPLSDAYYYGIPY